MSFEREKQGAGAGVCGCGVQRGRQHAAPPHPGNFPEGSGVEMQCSPLHETLEAGTLHKAPQKPQAPQPLSIYESVYLPAMKLLPPQVLSAHYSAEEPTLSI